MVRNYLTLLVAFACLITGCEQTSFVPTTDQRSDGTTLFSGEAMTIRYRVIVGAPLSPEDKKHIANAITSSFQMVHSIYDKWNPDSELSQLNKLKKGEQHPLSPELYQLLSITDQVVQLSGGRFDPTIEPIQRLWKEKLRLEKVPSSEEINAVKPFVGWKKIHFTSEMFYKDEEEAALDLGGIAKGHGIDLLTEALLSLGFQNVYVEWGGEIRAHGQHPTGRPWTIYISRLWDEDPTHAIATIHLKDQAIATSGDYLQNQTVKGATYFHIYDPISFQPLQATASSIASASVVANTCALADGLATAAMMFPTKEEATEWFNQLKSEDPSLSLWLVTRRD